MYNTQITMLTITNSHQVYDLLCNMVHKSQLVIKKCIYSDEYLDDIKSKEPHLIFIDIFNCDLTIEIIKSIRSIEKFRELPIIIGINNKDIINLNKFIEIGIADYVCKPYKEIEVNIRIKNSIDLIDAKRTYNIKNIQFNAILNNTPYMAWFKDKESNYIKVNQWFMEHCGKDMDTIRGNGDIFVWDGKIGTKCREYDLEVMNKRKQIVFDEVIPGKKGYREFNIFKAPVMDLNDNVVGTIGIARDTTELKNKDARLNIILENIPFGVWLKDKEGSIINVNSEYVKYFNIKKEQIIGKKLNVMFDNETYESITRSDIEIMNNRKPVVFDRIINLKGKERVLEVYKSPVFDISNEVIGIVGLFRDVTVERQIETQIRKYAYTDVLTNLPNRRALFEYFNSKEMNSIELCCVMLIDVDNFKHLNDAYGHYYGDNVLIVISGKLKKICKGAYIAKISGDEFVVIWENINIKEIKEKADELIDTMKAEFYNGEGGNVISISMGIALAELEKNIEKLFIKSDLALNKAKENGKNQYVFYTDELEEERLFKLEIEQDLKKAIKRNEIELVYQPQYTINGKLKGFEALFRWNNPKYFKVSVIKIIEIIEKSNLIDTIGDYIIREACKFAKKININRKEKILVSMNISAIQIMNVNFVSRFKSIIGTVGVCPEEIGIEITETVLLENIEANIKKIKELKDLGITISLDDFGIGYSSFNYLVKLPLSIVKIDRSFIVGMNHGNEYRILVRLIVESAHSLNMPVVAEGVERQEELEILSTMDVDYIQGYVFSKPLSVEAAEELTNNEK